MIERFLEKLIEELGATGLLVIGLYFILYKPLNSMSKWVHNMNHSLSKIVFFLTNEITKNKDGKDKD